MSRHGLDHLDSLVYILCGTALLLCALALAGTTFGWATP